MKVQVSKQALASIHSIGVGTSTDDVAPVITQIALKREGDNLRAIATDRYVIVSGLYKNATFTDWADEEEILVDPKRLKDAVNISKANKYDISPVEIAKDQETGAVSALLNSVTSIDLGGVTGSFPPVMKLFPTDEPKGAGALNIRPDFLAKLAKVLPPDVRPERNRVWRFEFRTSPESNKPQPVYAQYSDADTYKLEALIQPALDKR